MRALGARGIGIHADYRHILGQQSAQGVLDLLGAQPHFGEVAAPTFGTGAAVLGVRTHAIGGTAGMALQCMGALMIGERRGAVLARGNAPALATHEEAREPTAVVEQHGLLALLHNLIERIEQGLGEDRAATGDELAAQVGHDDLGQAGRAGALGHLDAGPPCASEHARLASRKRLGRRRG